MTYELSAWTGAKTISTALQAADYASIIEANRLLRFGLGIEEKLDLVLENYAELELSILRMALQSAVFNGDDVLKGGRHIANRHAANYLATSRLYLDQTAHALSDTFGAQSNEMQSFNAARSNEYDSTLGYRVMEQLRNHAQHRNLPIQSLMISMKHDEIQTPPLHRHSVSIALAVPALEADPTFKASVLEELKNKADSRGFVPLLPMVRSHVEAFGRLHAKVRQMVAPGLAKADECIDHYHALAANVAGTKVSSVKAHKLTPQGTWEEEHNATQWFTDRRKEFERKNKHLEKLSIRYVSSQH